MVMVAAAQQAVSAGETASGSTTNGPMTSRRTASRLADAAVVVGRTELGESRIVPAKPESSELVFQPQSHWALHLAGDDSVASLDAAIDLDQPVKVHTPLAQRGDTDLDLLPGEPAHEILELMESSGGSVLEGTLFNGADELSADQERKLRRHTIVQTIRQLQEDDAQQTMAVPGPTTAEMLTMGNIAALPATQPGAASIDEMRRVCDQLDKAASDLERQELYQFADRLRETAQEMRLEARRLAAGTRLPNPGRATSRPAEEASAEGELRMLREELNHLRRQVESRPQASTVSYPRSFGLEVEPASSEIPALFAEPVDE